MNSNNNNLKEKFADIIAAGVRSQFSDLHITGGHPLVFRQNGVINFDNRFMLTPGEIDSLVSRLLNNFQMKMLRNRHSVDFSMSAGKNRVRVNVFNTTRGLSIAVRILSAKVPSLAELNLHGSLKDLCRHRSGLILICGATGCGKSTTIAGLIDHINRTRASHIVTLEDPVEYRFKSDKAFIEQRELGTHFPSYERGLLDVLREDPDVIVVGELRETEAMRLTLDAAESGHLVIATMHAANVWECLYRMCNSFPIDAQELVRYQLSTTLQAVVAQQLHYYKNHGFRLPVLSILLSNSSVRGIIKDNKFSQLENVMQTGRARGMFTFEQYQNEYLEKQTRFIPPSLAFNSAGGFSDHENYYDSNLVDQNAFDMYVNSNVPHEEPGNGSRPKDLAASRLREDVQVGDNTFGKDSGSLNTQYFESNFFDIDGAASIEEVIRELRFKQAN